MTRACFSSNMEGLFVCAPVRACVRKSAWQINKAVCAEREREGPRMNAQALPHKARLEQHPGALLLHSERASKAKQSRGAKNRPGAL